MGGLFWARIVFPKPLELEFFFLTYNRARFFFQHYIRHEEILFSEGYYFSLVYPCKLFSLEICLQDIFF